MSGLNERIRAHGAWRGELAAAVGRYREWLERADLSDAAVVSRLARIGERLRDDRLTVAFVAEFSRGKSELINALFFADYGQRVVPSAAGRTTMCPTELMHDPAQPPGIRLLPIETRLRDTPVADLRRDPEAWRTVPFDPARVESVRLAFECVRETKRVPVDTAVLMGLFDETDVDAAVRPDADDMVEVSCWRHAVVNIPHPLLDTGLVIIDTPGLNAIGAEPELTLNIIPSANAVLFVLAADAGVTRTDAAVWREHIGPAHHSGRLVVLNKIDGLWDALKSPAEVDREIDEQVASVARMLELPRDRVFPVSAQKGLLARISGDEALLARSRLLGLEHALAREMVPQRRAIVAEQVRRDFDEAHALVRGVLGARQRSLVEQAFELGGLRGKNRSAVEQMARRIRGERTEFEGSLRKLQALRKVLRGQQQAIDQTVGLERLKGHVRAARQAMRASRTSMGLRDGMASLLDAAHRDFADLTRRIDEVQALMAAMYSSFNREHGFTLGVPLPYSTRRFASELLRVEAVQQRHFGAMSLVTTEKWALTRRFFESVAARLRDLYEQAGREVDGWMRAIFAPIESQVREHQQQLRRRIDAVQRVLEASEALDARIDEIEEDRAQAQQRLDALEAVAADVNRVLDRDEAPVGEPQTA
jgi:predicted GTPase